MQDNRLLNSFINYCHNHPDERFWQALRNWAELSYLIADFNSIKDDTFYWTEKNEIKNKRKV